MLAHLSLVQTINDWNIRNKTSSFNAQVSLRTYKTHFCTATILTPRHLLTAANCVRWNYDNPTAFSVQYGKVDTSIDDGNSITVSNVVMDSKYPNNLKYDIAVIKLESELPINENQTIEFRDLQTELAEEEGKEEEKYEVKFIGWGYTSNDEITTLKSVDVQIYSDAECAKQDRNKIDTYYHICGELALDKNMKCDTYNGSPLLNITSTDAVQLGIASFVAGKKGDGCIMVFTKVNRHSDFINYEMKQ